MEHKIKIEKLVGRTLASTSSPNSQTRKTKPRRNPTGLPKDSGSEAPRRGAFQGLLQNGPKAALVRILALTLLFTTEAHADFEGTLQNLVSAFTGRLLPIMALGYLGKNIIGHVQGDPMAKQETVRVVVAIAALLGINGVWAYIAGQVR